MRERSGDIIVMLKPHIMPVVDTSRYAATHGSPWDYDRRVPIAFWRKGPFPPPHGKTPSRRRTSCRRSRRSYSFRYRRASTVAV